MVHYIVLDFETDFGEGIFGPDEVVGHIDWLKADLAAVDRSKTPWVLAFAHRPYYVAIGDARCKECQEAFEDILFEGNVDIMMNGHGAVRPD